MSAPGNFDREPIGGLEEQGSLQLGSDAACARVMVVDDDPVNHLLIVALLNSRGLLSLQAADGAQAVALASQHRLDLILMDLQMPVLGGLEATSAIRRFESAHARPPVPVLAYTSTPLGASILAAHGLNGSLNKPCADRDLEECLVRWCPSYGAASLMRGNGRDGRDGHTASDARDARDARDASDANGSG